MSDIPDLRLHNTPARDDMDDDTSLAGALGAYDDERSERSKWLVLIVLFLIGASVVSYVLLRRARATVPQIVTAPAVSAPAPAAAPPRSGPLVEADNIALPPLAETDALMRALVVKLSSHPMAMAWLATNGLIENFTVATLN